MFKITIFAALFAIAMAGTAQAETPISACVARYAPTAVLSGSGSYHAFFLHIYDARLYTRAGTHGDVRPYALSLTYFRKLEGKKIAAKTIEEMKHVGAKEKSPLAAWQHLSFAAREADRSTVSRCQPQALIRSAIPAKPK